MSIGKHFLRWGVLGVVLAAGCLGSAAPAAAIPMPDYVGRVPVVGLLPRWTWDPAWRPAPNEPVSADDNAERASAFVIQLVAAEYPTGIDVVATYRLDADGLYAVEVRTPDGASASFTVELLDSDGEPGARLVGTSG